MPGTCSVYARFMLELFMTPIYARYKIRICRIRVTSESDFFLSFLLIVFMVTGPSAPLTSSCSLLDGSGCVSVLFSDSPPECVSPDVAPDSRVVTKLASGDGSEFLDIVVSAPWYGWVS